MLAAALLVRYHINAITQAKTSAYISQGGHTRQTFLPFETDADWLAAHGQHSHTDFSQCVRVVVFKIFRRSVHDARFDVNPAEVMI